MSEYIYYNFDEILINTNVSEEFLDAVEKHCEEYEVTVECARYYPGRPAKLFALPEDCHPEESPEVELSEDDDGLADKAYKFMVASLPLSLLQSKTFSEDLKHAEVEILTHTIKQLELATDSIIADYNEEPDEPPERDWIDNLDC